MDKLTDEQLREYADRGNAMTYEWRMIATELLALRAERAKPTQSDEERAHALINRLEFPLKQWTGINRSVVVPTLAAAFASIRAEGSAERAKLEAAVLGLVEAGPPVTNPNVAFACKYLADRLRLLFSALAQPAESGATERGITTSSTHPVRCICDGCNDARALLAGAKP